MGLSEKLVEIKSETEALITYANGVTGESDTRLGDAILSLAEGYGQGGETVYSGRESGIELVYHEKQIEKLCDIGYNNISWSTTAQELCAAGTQRNVELPSQIPLKDYTVFTVASTKVKTAYNFGDVDVPDSYSIGSKATQIYLTKAENYRKEELGNNSFVASSSVNVIYYSYWKNNTFTTTQNGMSGGVSVNPYVAGTNTTNDISSYNGYVGKINGFYRPKIYFKGNTQHSPSNIFQYIDFDNSEIEIELFVFKIPRDSRTLMDTICMSLSDNTSSEYILGNNSIHISSTGMMYAKKMTMNILKHNDEAERIENYLDHYGKMEHLEELYIRGRISKTSTNATISSSSFSSSKLPNLKKLTICPDILCSNDTPMEDPLCLVGHYVFNGTNLTHLVLGGIGMPFSVGAYFRNDLPNPPSSDKYNCGSVDGLDLTIYCKPDETSKNFLRQYAPNTTVHHLSSIDGSSLD